MKERPILFSAPMVRAILEGRKTQTRRVINRIGGIGQVTEFQCSDTPGYDWIMRDKGMRRNDFTHASILDRCPHGKIGDVLWVKETFGSKIRNVGGTPHESIVYRADNNNETYCYNSEGIDIPVKWKPSIHMPRSASRINLEITGIRVERLQDISEKDAVAEGVYADGSVCLCETPLDFVRSCGNCGGRLIDAVDMYSQLWESINGKGSFDLNPFCWVIEFKRSEL